MEKGLNGGVIVEELLQRWKNMQLDADLKTYQKNHHEMIHQNTRERTRNRVK